LFEVIYEKTGKKAKGAFWVGNVEGKDEYGMTQKKTAGIENESIFHSQRK